MIQCKCCDKSFRSASEYRRHIAQSTKCGRFLESNRNKPTSHAVTVEDDFSGDLALGIAIGASILSGMSDSSSSDSSDSSFDGGGGSFDGGGSSGSWD